VKRIGQAPGWLAPEREKELLNIIKEGGIKVQVHGEQSWFEADTSYGVIRLNLETLERLWMFCFGYLKIWHLKQSEKWPDREIIKLTEVPRLARARAMLHWATADHQGFFETTRERMPREGREPWPKEFPTPEVEDEDNDVKAANTFFISVCAFILLHEIGHTVGKHSIVVEGTGEPSKKSAEEMEYEADDFAVEFLLRDWKLDERKNMYIQRAVAIVTGLSLQASLEPYERIEGEREHPCTPDRFLHFWKKFVAHDIGTSVPIGSVVDAFHLIISLHALNAAIEQLPAPELGAHYETINDYLKAVRPLFGCKD